MRTLKSLSFEEANSNSQEIFNAVKGKIGMVPNLYAAMGVSDKLLGGFLSFTETLKSGELSAKEYEAVALATSQANGCAYCLSAHTAIGKMNGLTDAETEQNRQGLSSDEKVAAGLNFAQSVTKNRGNVSADEIAAIKVAGYTDGDVLEIVLNVVANTLTNYVNHIAKTEIDFPEVNSGKFTINA